MQVGKLIHRWQYHSVGIEVVTALMGSCGLGKHFHDVWSVGIIMDGTCRFVSGSGHHEAKPTQLFIIPPHEVHSCAAATKNVQYVVLYVEPDTMRTFAPDFCDAFKRTDSRVWDADDHGVNLLHGLEKNYGPHWITRWLASLGDLDINSVASYSPLDTSIQMHPLQQILHHQWRTSVNWVEVESATRYSRWHAIRTFQTQVGLTPSSYLRQLRVLKARHMLQTGDALVDVANFLYFADQAHFSRAFKTVFGVPPGKLRQLMQEDSEISEAAAMTRRKPATTKPLLR